MTCFRSCVSIARNCQRAFTSAPCSVRSLARGEAGESSDVDLLVEFSEPPGFDGYMNLKFWIEERLGCRVDLVMQEALKPAARAVLESEVIHVA